MNPDAFRAQWREVLTEQAKAKRNRRGQRDPYARAQPGVVRQPARRPQRRAS